MTPIEQIKAEILRLKEIQQAEAVLHPQTIRAVVAKFTNENLDKILSFIESLEKEQDVDLEKAIDDYVEQEGLVNIPQIEPIARHFYALGKNAKDNAPKIKGWVARDECLCFFQGEKPKLSEKNGLWHNTEYDPIYLDESLFPDIQLENSPVEFELTIHRV